jgi:hypothetical protein
MSNDSDSDSNVPYMNDWQARKRYFEYLLDEIKGNKTTEILIYVPFIIFKKWRKEIENALEENVSITSFNLIDCRYHNNWSFVNRIIQRNRKIQDVIRESEQKDI